MPRLDQLLTSLGYGTRREVQGIILRGHVTVSGEMAERPDVKVNAADVLVKGQPLEGAEGLLVMLHKPVGYVCTHSTDEGHTIYELLPPRWLLRRPPLTSIGRLDKDTSGLLMLTDKGELIQKWTSPKSSSEKVYVTEVDKPLSPELIDIMASGTLMLRGEEKPCLPAKLEILGETTARLTLTEGKYHQVRRMFASQGWHVTALHRSHFAGYDVGDLPAGEWRILDLPAR